MTYVVTNLHGNFQKYCALLEKIHFGENDILYVLGDTVDYGEQTMELLTDMSMRVNVYPIAGEHDFLALRLLRKFDRLLREQTAPDMDFASEMKAWVADGGEKTLDAFRALDSDMKEGIIDYLSEFALFEEIEVGGKTFVLVHAGIGDFDAAKPLDDYGPEDFFVPAEPGKTFFADRTLVVGHRATESGKIERSNGVIYLDCGVKDGGQLACLCLENNEEIYV